MKTVSQSQNKIQDTSHHKSDKHIKVQQTQQVQQVQQMQQVQQVQQVQGQQQDGENSNKTKKSHQKPNEDEGITWPIYKADKSQKALEKFWDKKNIKVLPKITSKFQGNMLRLGKKKKTPKGYYFKLSSDGVLYQFKKEGDAIPKGHLQITQQMVVTLTEQKNKKESLLIVQIEKFEGFYVTFFDHKSQLTLEFFDALKDFCVVSGFDRLYVQLEILGKGSFASVYKIKSMYSDKMYAAKTYFRETFDTSQHKNKFVVMINNEILALRKVNHPGIIQLYEVVQEKDKLILVMEFVQGGDLYMLIKEQKKLNEKQAAYMMKSVCEALFEMHKNGFVHRDLKLENIMMKGKDSWDIKLVDFGFAEAINEKELVSKAGTPGYIPPEIFKLNPYTAKGDVFSVGIIFYSLISGISAFKGRNYQAVLEENRKCEISFERSVWHDVSLECKSLLKKMIAPKPQNRYTCEDVLDHDWIIENTMPEHEKRVYSNSALFQKQMTKQKSLYNPSDGSQDFECEFSYQANDLKSFYVRNNSQKTFKTQKSNVSRHSNNGLVMQKSMKASRSASAARQQFVSIKSQTMKASQHRSISPVKQISIKDGGQQQQKKKGYNSEQASFGEMNGDDNVLSQNDQGSLKMFNDDGISVANLTFLRLSVQIFNKSKKVYKDFRKK